MTATEIIQKYISFFEKKGHKRIANSPLVPENDPTTLFTSSGMQPLVPYLLGEKHPMGKRLANVQNCFRAADIDEVGDRTHTTFFRMLGNWSLGDYFKKEELPWLWELLTKEFNLPKEKLYISVFMGYKNIQQDTDSYNIWREIVKKEGLNPSERIFFAGVDKNWWSRSGTPDKMPIGEIGGPDTEVYYKFDDVEHGKDCKKDDPTSCRCGKFLEIANSVFMQYQKQQDGTFKELPQKNVDYGGGLERLLAAVENKSDIFQTSLFSSIVQTIELKTNKSYKNNEKAMRIVVDHLTASVFITANGVMPSNKEQGYILRRLIRRAMDNLNLIRGIENLALPTKPIIESIIAQYRQTDPMLETNSQKIINTIIEELNQYRFSLIRAKNFIKNKYKIGDELLGQTKISTEDAFLLYATHGLSPTQIKSLNLIFNDQEFAEKMKQHQQISRKGSLRKFKGGLADHSEKTIMGHTATHLLHQAIRDVLGNKVFQSGSNITSERVRFDFNFDRKLTDEEMQKIEKIVNQKIEENLPVHFEMLPLKKAKGIGAIGLFDEKYQDTVKVYFIGQPQNYYSIEFCGGPHVDFTGKLKRFRIIKQENIGKGYRRLYAVLG